MSTQCVCADSLGSFYAIHGGLLILVGLIFGFPVMRSRVFPQWAGMMLVAGVVASAVIDA